MPKLEQDALDQAMGLLEEEGLMLPESFRERLLQYTALLRDWNSRVSLVSQGDLQALEQIHLPDALSLASFVRHATQAGGSYLDIGSGGGFPAIPLSLLLPDLEVVLLERSERKLGFLRKVRGALGLRRVRLLHGSFPEVAAGLQAVLYTARAVERAETVQTSLGTIMDGGAVFLCQSGSLVGFEAELFHVERIEDRWSALGLRRGSLHRITRQG